MAKIKRTMTVSLEEFGKKAGEYVLDEFEYNGLTIRQWADKITSGEYQPVKHGRWEHGECSVCGASPLDHVNGDMYVEVDYYPNYCPSCGSQNVDLWIDDESVPNEDMRPDLEGN